ncbi:beta-N-acetylglucosaminidase domain-containing protein [Bauldia sp.]|uniref:beta-N-acetylglucosaminidase domain-containing protein n=1 Tax=Bauldia sp. TaxID=2575872 RepID=UPI003BABE350
MLTGVIEGFYGRAWRDDQRLTMLDWITAAGMNTFVYAPKDDIHIRARWREPYGDEQLNALAALAETAKARGVAFNVALAPCLDITYSDPAEMQAIVRRFDQLTAIGIEHFTLLFDDIPNRLPEADRGRFASFAAAQCFVANAVVEHLRPINGTVLFCPTEYCARFAGGDVTASPYLNEIGTALDPEIGVFWTGPEIVSPEITAASLAEIGAILRRKPVIWENFHANDYDVRRVCAGPLGGRNADILPLIAGYITNPNNEFAANFVPVRTTGRFLNDPGYTPENGLDEAIEVWRPAFRFAYHDPPETMTDDEIRLLVELFYQPFACGPEIDRLLDVGRALLASHRPDTDNPIWQAGYAELTGLRDRIATLFTCMTEIADRDLFHAFHPYLWEAREEITHLVAYLGWLNDKPAADAWFPGDEHIHNFYRRGFTVGIQELLKRDDQGRYYHDDG